MRAMGSLHKSIKTIFGAVAPPAPKGGPISSTTTTGVYHPEPVEAERPATRTTRQRTLPEMATWEKKGDELKAMQDTHDKDVLNITT